MILTGSEIHHQVSLKRIRIQPYDKKQITTNSYDLHIGSKYIKYESKEIDLKKPSSFSLKSIPESGLTLNKSDFILAETLEKVGSDYFVPILHAKSGTARSGLFVHITADLIDIGSYGKLTLQLYATVPVKIYPNSLIAQVTFWKPYGEISLYNGKYQSSDGPKPSLSWKD